MGFRQSPAAELQSQVLDENLDAVSRIQGILRLYTGVVVIYKNGKSFTWNNLGQEFGGCLRSL